MFACSLSLSRTTLSETALSRWMTHAVLCLAVLAGLSGASHARAFDLTPAQTLVYDSAHLTNTHAGDTVAYRYRSESLSTDPFEGDVTLEIRGEEEGDRRHVSIDFLSGERHMNLPDFDGYRGNPVIIATLEQFAQTFSAETGGGTLYFRNRLRNALAAKDVELINARADYAGESVQTTEVTLRPFVGDAHVGANPRYRDTTVAIVISDSVPAGVLRIEASSVSADDGTPYFTHTLTVE